MEASKNLPDHKAGVTPKRFRTRFPLTSFAPIAVEVREVEPIEVVRKPGRIAIHVTPETAERIRAGDRESRLALLRAIGRKLLFILPPRKVYGFASKDAREAEGRKKVDDFARDALDAARKGRAELVRHLALAVETRASNAPELTGWPYPDGDRDEERDAGALADIVLDLLNFGAVPDATTGPRPAAPGASSHL